MKTSTYTPSLLDPAVLEALFVKRHRLVQQLVERVQDSVLTENKHYSLLYGPRGIGKTHIVSLVYARVKALEELQGQIAIAWLREEEWGIGSFFDLVAQILRALQTEYKDSALKNEIDSLYLMTPEEAEEGAIQLLKDFLGIKKKKARQGKTLLLLMENLDQLFGGLGTEGQKKFRSFLQETGCCTIVATSPSLFDQITLQSEPFYGFFNRRELKDFTVEDAIQMLRQIAKLEGNEELGKFLLTTQGKIRIKAVHELTGGSPRLYTLFSKMLTQESLEDLIEPILKMLDDLTPYYQARMQFLSPQQQKIIGVLCRYKKPRPVKEIAQWCFASQQTIGSQLKDLREKGYVRFEKAGRESFYELREPLMRICLSVKEERGHAIKLIATFLKSLFTTQELGRLRSELTSKRKEQTGERRSLLYGKISSGYKILSPDFRKTLLELLSESTQEESDPRIFSLKEDLNRSLEKQQFNDALAIVNSLIKLGENYLLWDYKGFILAELSKLDDAITSFDKAIELKPDFDNAWYNRGIALVKLGRLDDAIASYDKAIQFKSDNDMAWYNRGVVLVELGRLDNAIASYDKAIEIKPDLENAWYNRGIALVKLGRLDDAIASFDKAIELKQDFEHAWNNRGFALVDLGQLDNAIASYDKAIEIKQNYENAWYNRGDTLVELGRLDDAIASYDKAIEIKPDFKSAWNNRGLVLAELGQLDNAIASFDKAIELKPDDGKAWCSRGLVIYKLERWEDAIASFDKALELKSDDDMAWTIRGLTLYNLGRFEEAIESLDQAIELRPDEVSYKLSRAELIFTHELSSKALQQLESILRNQTPAQLEGWQFEIGINAIFQRYQDPKQWKKWLTDIIALFDQFDFSTAITQGLTQQLISLLPDQISQTSADLWRDVWQELVSDRDEFQIPLRLLNGVVEYKKAHDDPRVFLALAIEERKILKQLLGVAEEIPR